MPSKPLQTLKLLLENQELTYPQVAKKIGGRTTSNAVGVFVFRHRERGLLPNKKKGTWTAEDIKKCLKRIEEESIDLQFEDFVVYQG